MAIMIEQRTQLFQSLGSIATSAADAAAEGIAEAVKTDSKVVDTALKLFGGFDRNEFENINGQSPNLLTPAVRPPASYEGPAEYFKPLSNTMQDQEFLVPSKELLEQLKDPRFRRADGLSGFSGNRITQTLVQTGISKTSKPGGTDPGEMGSLDSFGKLYRMENTIAKQLQLHDQLDLGALGRLSAPKTLPSADNPKLNQGLKGMPDAQATTPSTEMVDLRLDHLLNGTPKTVSQMHKMADSLQYEIRKLYKLADILGFKDQLVAIYTKLSAVGNACNLYPGTSPPNEFLVEAFEEARSDLKQFDYFS